MADLGRATSIRAKLQSMPDLSTQPCIYKTPSHLRKMNEECYQPYVVSIGPLYYGLPSLEPMQHCKLRCLKFFLEHESNPHRFDLEHYLRIVEEMEGSVRDCYAERITVPSDEFNEMILADSAFIICVLKYHPILDSPLAAMALMHEGGLLAWGAKLTRDLFLLENQVPFFVLERLFTEAFGAAHPRSSFCDVAVDYLKRKDVGIPVVRKSHDFAAACVRIKITPKIAHLVHLLWTLGYPSILKCEAARDTDIRFPSNLSYLKAAGVKIVASNSMSLFDITFVKGVLKIPPIQLEGNSESFYRSIALFEQTYLPVYRHSYLVDYVVLLNKLIKTPEDVQLLVKCGVIDNWIGSAEEVAKLFNGITQHLSMPSNFSYACVCRDLHSHANTRRHRWKAILKKDYLSHPWVILSVIYALIILLLTFLQTLGTFLHP